MVSRRLRQELKARVIKSLFVNEETESFMINTDKHSARFIF